MHLLELGSAICYSDAVCTSKVGDCTAETERSQEWEATSTRHRLYKYKSSLDPIKKNMRNVSYFHGLGPRVMSHRGRPESAADWAVQLATPEPRSPHSPMDMRTHKAPKTRLENKSPQECKSEDEYMDLLATLSREAACAGNSISCNGWSNTFMPSKKHFPAATRSRVPVGASSPIRCAFNKTKSILYTT
jgi:hypothetical protein